MQSTHSTTVLSTVPNTGSEQEQRDLCYNFRFLHMLFLLLGIAPFFFSPWKTPIHPLSPSSKITSFWKLCSDCYYWKFSAVLQLLQTFYFLKFNFPFAKNKYFLRKFLKTKNILFLIRL